MYDPLANFGFREGTLLASLFGSLVALKFVPGDTAWERLTNVAGGALIAAYSSPFVTNYFALNAKLEASVAFIIGVFGMTITSSLVEHVPIFIKAIIRKYAK